MVFKYLRLTCVRTPGRSGSWKRLVHQFLLDLRAAGIRILCNVEILIVK